MEPMAGRGAGRLARERGLRVGAGGLAVGAAAMAALHGLEAAGEGRVDRQCQREMEVEVGAGSGMGLGGEGEQQRGPGAGREGPAGWPMSRAKGAGAVRLGDPCGRRRGCQGAGAGAEGL